MILTPRLQLVAMLAIFCLAMLGLRDIARLAVTGGPIAWLALMGAIFAAGLWLENRRRMADGRPSYSLAEARELVLPLAVLAGVLAFAFWR